MKTTRDTGISYLIVGVGLGLLAGALLALRSQAETWEQFRRGASDSFDYLTREGEKVRASADEFMGKTKEWLTRIGNSLRSAKDGGKANSGESPSFD
jgi:hypothetical protein